MKPRLSVFTRLATCILCLIVPGCGGGGGGGSVGVGADSCDLVQPKIANGAECPAGIPSQVARLVFTESPTRQLFCSGVLIAPRAVLTAAHCLEGAVSAGLVPEVELGSVTVPVDHLEIHPNYFVDQSERALFNDVGVIVLAAPAPVAPIPPATSFGIQPGMVLSIYGYGQDENQEFGALKAGESIVSGVTANHILAVFSGEGSDTCVGDSGGPAIIKEVDARGQFLRAELVGITSSGTPTVQCGMDELSYYANLESPEIQTFLRPFLQ